MKDNSATTTATVNPFSESEVIRNFHFFKTLIHRQFPGFPAIDDLAQEALIRVWSKQHLYDPNKSSFSTWSTRICIYLCLDYLRKIKAKPTVSGKDFDLWCCPHSTSPDTIGLSALVNTLDFTEREVIDLAYFRGFTHQEIADYMHVPLGTVKTRILRGIKKLRYYFPEALN